MINITEALKVKKIYNRLADEESKMIFSNRFLYSVLGDKKYIRDIIQMTAEGKYIHEILTESRKPKVVFGAGVWGGNIVETYDNIDFTCFIDNKTIDKERIFRGIPVISFQRYLEEYQDALVVISSRLYHDSIYQQLRSHDIREENIINAGRLIDDMSRRQYFDLPKLSELLSEDGESFVDAGCFDGKTSIQFSEWDSNYRKIWAFEPDSENAEKCMRNLTEAGIDPFELINRGLWDESTKLSFKAQSNGSSKVDVDGESSVYVARMDEIINDRVTFIKMDIEGSEYKALVGAEKIIKRDKPKLAISIYHKPEDIWEIPALILEMNPEYKFYLRHYSIAASETVLYAV